MTLTLKNPAPLFSGATDGSGTISLESLRGKNVVLFFYPKDNTSGCTVESCGFRDALSDFTACNTVIVGVSKDSVKSHDKFKKDHDLNFPLLSDGEGLACDAYGVIKEKSMYGKKYLGIERSTFLIDAHGVLQQIWQPVTIAGHVPAVLHAAQALHNSAQAA
jgi:peroxiredoxin Q/BCP